MRKNYNNEKFEECEISSKCNNQIFCTKKNTFFFSSVKIRHTEIPKTLTITNHVNENVKRERANKKPLKLVNHPRNTFVSSNSEESTREGKKRCLRRIITINCDFVQSVADFKGQINWFFGHEPRIHTIHIQHILLAPINGSQV